MPFFHLATTDDHDELEQSLNKTLKQTVKNIMKDHDDYRNDISRLDTCTKLIKGVYVCDKPMYEKVIAPRDLKVKDVASPSDNICLKVETLDDLMDSENIKEAKRYLGDLDVPDNYLCLEKTSLEKYVNAFIPERILRYADTVKDEKLMGISEPHCYSECRQYTCEEIKNKRSNLSRAYEIRKERFRECEQEAPQSRAECMHHADMEYRSNKEDLRKFSHFPKTVEIGCGACSATAKCKPFA